MIVDTHAHLSFNAFKDDVDEVIKRSLAEDIWMINPGSQYDTSKRGTEIAERYKEGFYAAVGLHPIHLLPRNFKTQIDKEEVAFQTREEKFDYEKYKELAGSKKVVAIGEVGLDYWDKPKPKARAEDFKNIQKETLVQQLGLAKELGLPVILHCRVAHEDLLEILEQRSGDLVGVIHCYTGNWEQAQRFMAIGFHIGFNGIIFKLNLDEIIKKTPLERILAETDCPYLTPPPAEGRNEPIYVKHTIQKIAELKETDFDTVATTTTQNARTLFKI